MCATWRRRSLAADLRAAAGQHAQPHGWMVDRVGRYPFDTYGVLAADQQFRYALETQTLSLHPGFIFAPGATRPGRASRSWCTSSRTSGSATASPRGVERPVAERGPRHLVRVALRRRVLPGRDRPVPGYADFTDRVRAGLRAGRHLARPVRPGRAARLERAVRAVQPERLRRRRRRCSTRCARRSASALRGARAALGAGERGRVGWHRATSSRSPRGSRGRNLGRS